jgi:hypothetical protein
VPTGPDHRERVVEGRGRELGVEVAGLVHLLEVLEASASNRIGGVFDFVVRVPLGPVGILCIDVEEVCEHEDLRRPGVGVGLEDGNLPGLGERLVVRHELVPRGRYLESELLVVRDVVEDSAAGRGTGRCSVHAVVGRDGGDVRLVQGVDPRLVSDVQE